MILPRGEYPIICCDPRLNPGNVFRWLYMITIAMDCNFRLRNKICGIHSDQMFRPQGLGDLQKGERLVFIISIQNPGFSLQICRQCNMDYVFASSIIVLGLQMLTVSYDVGCQWWTRFNSTRRDKLPHHLQILPPWIRALVPKFHLQSHRESCHSPFSFNYATGSAHTDGEGVERNWAELNGQAASTAEMLPGHRLGNAR